MTLATALFRAFDIFTLDYPWEAAIYSALEWCDEAVVVVGTNSTDQTCDALYELQNRLYGRVFVVPTHIHFESRTWQEDWWSLASSYAVNSDWLVWLDLDELVEEPFVAREALEDPVHDLLNFEFVHLFGTANLRNNNFMLKANTRAGRRRVNYRLKNLDEGAACAAVYGVEEYNAHDDKAPGWVRVETPILHYGWCRDAAALSISQQRHRTWYDLVKPEPWPERQNFRLQERLLHKSVEAHNYIHPEHLRPWINKHCEEWWRLEQEAGYLDAQ